MNTDHLILDRYRLTHRLAVGGSAEVWRARDEQLGRDVAVKLLHAHLLPDHRSRGRLAAEARAAAGLSHPGVVGIYDMEISADRPALIMELVDGETLATRIERIGPLPASEAARIVAEVAEALAHAHQRSIIHRDVKPANILLDAGGAARLVDFGIARSLAESAQRLTLTGNVIGTLHYMAPEQLSGEPVSPRTDLYGLGVVLHEALTGHPPFAAPSAVPQLEAQRGGVSEMTGVDPGLVNVTRACLAFEPSSRPSHAGGVAAALRSWITGDSRPALAMAHAPTADAGALTRPMQQPAVRAGSIRNDASPTSAPPAAEHTSPRSRARSLSAALTLGAIGAAGVIAAVGFAVLLSDGIAEGVGPTASPTPSPTAQITLSPLPTPFDLASLPGGVRKEVQDYLEACGGSGPPIDVTGMQRRDVARTLEPYIDECRGGGEDEDD